MVARRSAEAVLKYSTVCPFRVRRSELCCVYCFDEFQSGAEFKQHMDTNHRLFNVSTAFSHCSTANEYLKVDCSDLRCRVCSEIFNSIEEIARHLHDIHDVRKINPDHKIFLQPYKIDDDNWVCVICNKRMPSLTKLCRHTTSHYQKFTCDICGRSYLTNEALKYHVRCNHSGSQYTCRKCWQEFLTDEEKKHHVQTSKQCWPFCCVHCCEKFKSWEGKQKHLEDVHGKPKKKYNCTDCNEVFESRKQFYSHYTLYHTNDSFMCTCCGMKFTKKHKLEDHKITHTGEKDFECDICNKLFTRKNTLKQHMYIHKVVKRFPCPVCNKQFAQKNPQRRNAVLLLKYSSAIPFKTRFNRIVCSYCHDELVSMEELRHHVNGKHSNADHNSAFYKVGDYLKVDITNFKCNFCMADFEIIDSFMRHISSEHDKIVDFDVPFGVLPFKQTLSGVWTCFDCDKIFQEFPQFNCHLRSHVKIFTCDKCGATFLSDHGLKQHEPLPFRIWGQNFNCIFCRVQSGNPNGLRAHMATRHANFDIRLVFNRRLRKEFLKVDITNLQCKLCFIQIESLDDLMMHLRNDHKQPINFDAQPGVLPFKLNDGTCWNCAICTMTFVDFVSLKQHTSEHYQNYVCDACGEGFVTEAALRAHKRKPHDNKYNCSRCVATFSTLDERSAHMKSQHTSMPYMCMVCKDKPRFATWELRKRHFMELHNFKPGADAYECTTCHMTFKTRSQKYHHNVKSHRSKKDTDYGFPCTHCSRAFMTKISLDKHIWKKNHFKCAFCESSFTNCLDLREHVVLCSNQHSITDIYCKFREMTLINVDVTNATCRICACPFTTIHQMRQHLIDHGFEFNKAQPDGVLPFALGGEIWRCVLCEEKFNNFLKLYEHMNVHYQHYICVTCGKGYMTGPRLRKHSEVHIKGLFKCQQCGKVFTKRTARDYHKTTYHSKGPRYECPHCGLRFRSYYHRMDHLKEIHRIKEVTYDCVHCDKSFKTSGKRALHVNYVHLPQLRQFSCSHCDWSFKTKYDLKRHMIKHTGERSFSCCVCNKTFLRSMALRNHLKIHSGVNSSSAYPFRWYRGMDLDILTAGSQEQRRRIVPLFQVDYDPTLCKPLGTISDFSKFRLRKQAASLTQNNFSPSRSPTPDTTDRRSPDLSLQINEVIPVAHSKKLPDYRQNALTVFEFSTVYPFIYGNNNFKCFICSQQFLDLNLLKGHMRDHTFAPLKRLINNKRENVLKVDISDLTCKLCSANMTDLLQLKYHLKEDHQKPIDPDLQDMLIPFKLDFANELYNCVICQQNFIKVRLLVIHMSVHFNNYSCEICGSCFMTLRLLKKHLEVHETGNFACDKCDKVFTTSYKRALHVRGVHLKQYPRRCPMCPERFNSNYRRTIHLQDVHNQSTRVHKCETCGRGFNLKYHLICHTRSVHLQERNHQCKVCLQRFCNKETLKRHMIIHTGEKKHKCDYCGLAFLRRKNLKDHLRMHEAVMTTIKKNEEFDKVYRVIFQRKKQHYEPIKSENIYFLIIKKNIEL
ncbi:unnamed protein product [Leptidea sinapis]|uniref:C2H2-type domain-containing protein n=1 Tax=Leptidea sinapis TaxID=189913 RepID=A0A5E4R7Q1_9NEOP|nr:unnamed protein product [Leptidea sinapis]